MTRTRFVELLGDWRQHEGPLYQRLAESIRVATERGDLTTGTRLPAQRVLAHMLSVSRTTVVMAYDALVEEQWLETREGSGTQVRATGTRPFPLREGAAAVVGSRNVLFRGLVERTGADIEFHGAHFDGLPEVFDEVWTEARADMLRLMDGPGYVPLGLPALREAISARLTQQGLTTRPEQLLVTNGAQQAISLIANLFIEPNDAVVIEDPTFLGAIDAFTSFGARLRGVASGPDGIHLETLRLALSHGTPRAVYLMPTCHNPTGSVLGESARAELARLAAASSAVWVEDNTLADLTLEGEPPLPLAARIQGGNVLTIGSLSKLFWGGLRVGWIRGPEPVITRLARMKVVTDLSGSLLSQAVAVRVLARAPQLVVQRRAQARQCLDHASRLLSRHLPSWSFRRPAGGLALWVRIPFGDATAFATHARGHGVGIVPGTVNSPEGRCHDHLRLPFVADPLRLEEGIVRLAAAWAEYAPVRGGQRASGMGVLV